MAVRLHGRLAGRLEAEGMAGVYRDLERPLIAVLARMEQARHQAREGSLARARVYSHSVCVASRPAHGLVRRQRTV